MKKQMKFAFLLITCCLAFTNCQKDDLETTQDPQQSKLVYRKIPFVDLSSRSLKTINELEKVLEKSKTNDLGRGLNENNSYTIDSTSVVYIDNGEGYSSYTFSVLPAQNDTYLQNIVISNYSNGETKAFLAEYELNKTVEQIGDDNFISSIKKTEFYNLNNSNMVYGRGSLCVDLGYEAIVNACEGELVTPGQNPECFNLDGTPATKKVFIIVASACSDSGSGGSGSTGSSPGTGTETGSGSSGGGGGTPNPNPSNPTTTTTTPEPNPNNPGEPVTVIGDVITSPTLPSPTGFKTFFSGLNLQQQEWLNLPENADIKNDMKAYLEQNSYSDLNQNYAESLIEEIMTNVDNSEAWSEDITLLDYSGPEISNITEYLECFDTTQSAVLTIYADQPVHNDNDSWAGDPTDPDVGHTFISIKQGSIRRVIGFYPTTGVNPFTNQSDSSSLVNDSGHSFDSSISSSISPAKLQSIITYITNYPSTYNLNSYNCTDFGISISKLGGINIPSAYGKWPGGSGDNPGQLGQNIRNMPLPSTGAVRNTTGGISPSNEGTCP